MDQIRSFFEYSFFGTQDYEESEGCLLIIPKSLVLPVF